MFVTAYDQYAVERFARCGRLPGQTAGPGAPGRTPCSACSNACSNPPATRGWPSSTLLETLAGKLRAQAPQQAWLQWIKASVGPAVRLIPVDQIHYLKSDTKYTLVVWDGGEALIRKTIRELADALDPERFIQIHRAVIVNLPAWPSTPQARRWRRSAVGRPPRTPAREPQLRAPVQTNVRRFCG